MDTRSLACIATALTLSACAPFMPTDSTDAAADTAGGGRQCFYANQVRNFRSAGITTVYLRANDNSVYEVNGAGGCRDLDFTNSLVITSDLPGLNERLCVGDSARITVPGAGAAGMCRVRISRALTAEQVAALPSAQRP